MSDPRTDLPSPSAPNFQQRIRETLMTYLGRQGNPLDRGLTLRDLLESGIIKLRDGFTLRPGGSIPIAPGPAVQTPEELDLTPPPTPSGFTVGAAISHVFIEHDAPLYLQGGGHLRTRVYGATWTSGPLPVFADAVEITQFTGTVHAHPSNPATTWHLWIKWETRAGVLSASPAGGTNGLVATTGQNVAQLLEVLTGQLNESQLTIDLNTRIDLIDGPGTDPGTVAYQIAQEAAARADALSIEAHQRLLGVQEAATAALNAALAADNERTDRITDVALARTELTTDIQEGLSAEAAQRTLLAAQLRGDYNGDDIESVTTGLLYEERIARATQDDALALSITLLAAGVGEQFDWARIWYWDTTIEGWGGNGQPTAAQGWLRPAYQASNAYVTSPETLGIDGDRYKQVRLRIRKVGAPTFAGLLWWATDAQAFDVSRQEVLVEPSYDANGIGVMTVNLAWGGTIDKLRMDLSSAQTATDYFEVDWFAVGRPSPGASTAQLLEEQQARASADFAEASARETLATAILGQADPAGLNLGNLTQGLLYDERVVRSTADSALAQDITLLEASVTTLDGSVSGLTSTVLQLEQAVADTTGTGASVTLELLSTRRRLNQDAETVLRNVIAGQQTRDLSEATVAVARQDFTTRINDGLEAEAAARLALGVLVDANAAAIVSEQIARADADSSLATSISTVSATANTKNRIFRQASAPDTGLTAGDLWFDTSDGNKPYRWDGAAWLDTTDTRLPGALAAIQTEATARADGDNALASQITTLQAGVNDNTVAIQTEATVRASETGALFGQYTIKVDNNGYVSGFGLASTANNGTPFSEFTIVADKFSIAPVASNPAADDGSPFFYLTAPTVIGGVTVPSGAYMKAAYIHDATITNAKIANLAVDNAKIANMSVDKLTAGSLQVGQWIQSTSYIAGTSGWRINADGTAEFNNVTVRGSIFATAGFIGGITIASNAVRAGQTGFNTGSGFYLGADGNFSVGNSSGNRLTWDGSALVVRNADASRLFDTGATGTQPVLKVGSAIEVLANGNATFAGALSAATGTFSGSLSAASGTFTGSLTAATGTFSGSLTADAINAVSTINLAGNAVTIPSGAYTAGTVTHSSAGTYTLASVTYTSVGSPTIVSFGTELKFTATVEATQTATVLIRRNGTTVHSYTYQASNGSEGIPLVEAYGPLQKTIVDTPSSGAVTYSLEVTVPTNSTFQAWHRFVTTIEAKR